MTGIGNDGAILHAFEVLLINDVDVARHGDENITESSCLRAGQHTVAIHHRFQGTSRINLGHDDVCAHAVSTRSHTTATPAIAEDDKGTAREQDVGRAYDGIKRTLPSTVAVVKHVLGIGFVDRQYGEAQDPIFLHAAQSNDTRGCLFHTTNDIGHKFSTRGMQC